LITVTAAPAQARWLRAEGPHFVVYSDGDERNLRTYVEQLEGFDDFLRLTYDIKGDEVSPRKLPVYLVGGRAELVRTWPGAPTAVVGYYVAGPDDIFAVATREETARPSGDVTHDYLESIVFKDYTHHFLLQYFPYAHPGWLLAGYGEYFGSTVIQKDYVDIGKPGSGKYQRLTGEEWIPLADVLGKTPDVGNEHQAQMFYAEAWLLTHYMMSDPERKKQLAIYVHEVEQGAEPVATMTKVTGRDLKALTRDLRDYLQKLRYHHYKRSKAIDWAKVTIEPLPPSADALLLESLSLERSLRPEDRPRVLDAVRTKAAQYTDDRLADLTLARAEIYYGERAAGEAILDHRLTDDPTDVDALVLAAVARLKDLEEGRNHPAELGAKAQSYFVAAHKLDPERYQALWTYAMTRRRVDPDYPSDNTLNVLEKALALAPQVSQIRLETARALYKRKKWAKAEEVLGPILHDPQDGEMSHQAQKLLDRIDADRPDN
jgi:hypothetical protein